MSIENIVFHGSRTGPILPQARDVYSGAPSAGLGEWFGTDSKEYAQQYGSVERCQIILHKPYYMDAAEFRVYDRHICANYKRSRIFREELQSKGFDGIVVTHLDGVKEFILFYRSSAQKID